MLRTVEGLIAELRRIGVPVRVSEGVDAVRALEHVDVLDRSAVKAALRVCLVKDSAHLRAFDTVFDLYFALPAATARGDGEDDGAEGGGEQGAEGEGGFGSARGTGTGRGGGLGSLDDDAIIRLLIEALRADDRHLQRMIAGVMVDRHAHIEPGRPVGGTYYLLRTMRAVKPDRLLAELTAGDGGKAGDGPAGGLERRLRVERGESRVERFRLEVESEIRRRLVADRGADAVARTLRTPLPEDVNFLTASQQEIAVLRTTLEPLSRKLAGRLARKRRHRRKGALDFRRTMRKAMSYGGAPLEPVFRTPRPSKPDLVVLADISGSVATFATFTLHLMSALRQQFAAVRSFVFVDGVDEVTELLASASDVAEAARQINSRGSGVWLDGRSDYGHALGVFWDSWGTQVKSRSTVMVLGDARTNYHAPREDVIAALRQRAAHVYWLNPEPSSAWDGGDSVISRYAPHCDAVIECRTVRQLKAFVESLD